MLSQLSPYCSFCCCLKLSCVRGVWFGRDSLSLCPHLSLQSGTKDHSSFRSRIFSNVRLSSVMFLYTHICSSSGILLDPLCSLVSSQCRYTDWQLYVNRASIQFCLAMYKAPKQMGTYLRFMVLTFPFDGVSLGFRCMLNNQNVICLTFLRTNGGIFCLTPKAFPLYQGNMYLVDQRLLFHLITWTSTATKTISTILRLSVAGFSSCDSILKI